MTPEEARALLEANREVSFSIDGVRGRPLAEITWQTGPHAEGRNGIEVDEAIAIVKDRVQLLDMVVRSEENARIIYHLQAAFDLVLSRRRDRDEQGVRGTLEPHRPTIWSGTAPGDVPPVPTEG